MAIAAYDTIIFDLGDVLFDWDEPKNVASLAALPKGAMREMMNSTTWYDLDRGLLPAEEAYKIMGEELKIEASLVQQAIDAAALSLRVNEQWAELVEKLAAKPGLRVYAMSNISKEHFEYIRTLPFPWEAFTRVFTSAAAGMRKPDLCFYQYVINETRCNPSRTIFLDDRTENIVAARSFGIRGEIVTESERTKEGRIYRFFKNVVLGEPLALAEAFLHSESGKLDSIYSEKGVVFRDNFAQLLIWGLTDMEDIIYLLWPDGTRWKGSLRCSSPDDNASVASSTDSAVVLNDKVRESKKSRPLQDGLWNYFTEKPVGTTETFPADADTTSIAYLTIPQEHLHRVADPKLVLDAMAANMNVDGIMQVYFTEDRPRICAIVSVNMLRFFLKYGGDDLDLDTDLRLAATRNFVVNCLANNAVMNGTRHYTTIESFLYFISLFFAELRAKAERNPTKNANLLQTLERHIYRSLVQSLGKPANPLALAMRTRACQVFGIERDLLRWEMDELLVLQEEDGGWPAGYFCRAGRTGADIGSRGFTTAMAWRILKDYEPEGCVA
ncbi:HAD-like domain-containing protein [Sordaria sp. MPI-SDFR-AT-0083]|nr:HAD-like domain-containing protein [Sordaria sp. MPI-SDFR-AT-0083]